MVERLFDNNKDWAARRVAEDPDYFARLEEQQSPRYLWIGCSDSRVPANQIVGLDPGEVFVHRNVANMVHPADLNALSVLQYAVEILKVRRIIVCGHYGCGGVRAAMTHDSFGMIDHWLRPIKDAYRAEAARLAAIPDEAERINLLCEFNVKRQVRNVVATNILQRAWAAGHDVSVHGWVYSLHDGLIRDLSVSVGDANQLDTFDRLAIRG